MLANIDFSNFHGGSPESDGIEGSNT